MAKAFHQELRKRVSGSGYALADVAERIGIEPSSLSHRLQYKTPWRLTDVYAICDMLDIPYRDIHVFFPPKETNAQRHDLTECDRHKYAGNNNNVNNGELSRASQLLATALERLFMQALDSDDRHS